MHSHFNDAHPGIRSNQLHAHNMPTIHYCHRLPLPRMPDLVNTFGSKHVAWLWFSVAQRRQKIEEDAVGRVLGLLRVCVGDDLKGLL